MPQTANTSFALTPEQEAAKAKALADQAAAFQAAANAKSPGAAIDTALKYGEADRAVAASGINAQAQNAGVQRADTQTSSAGIAGFFGGKDTANQYTAGDVADTTTAGNRATLGARLAGVDARQNQTMQAAVLGPEAQARAAQLGAAQQAQAAQLGPSATIAAGPQDQFRARQMTLAEQLGAGAIGQGPSAAQAQLKLATDRNMAQSLALALGARGGNQAAAMKQAQMQRALIGQEAGGQSAVLAAQEQQAAQQSLGQLLGTGRGADIGLATNQAGLQQQTALQQGNFAQQAALANQGAANDFALQQGQFAQQAGLANQAAAVTQAGFVQQANQANLTAGVDQQKQKDALVQSYLAQGMALDQAQQQAEIQQRQFNASLLAQQEAARQGVSAQNSAAAGQATGATAAALGTVLAAAASDRRAKRDVRAGERSLAELLGAGMPRAKAPKREPSLGERLALGTSTSDERAKTEIETGEASLGELLSGVGAWDYAYKDPDKPLRGHGRFVSPMAQEIEKTAIGKSMVKDTPDGKVVDYGKGLGAMLSGMGWIHKRVEEIEEKLSLGARLSGGR